MIHALCLHRVLSRESPRTRPYFVRGTAMTPRELSALLEYLSRDFDMLDERQVCAWLDEGRPPRRRPGCWITFDDGYADNLAVAAPILASFGVRPTLFLTTGLLSGSWRLPVDRWYDVLATATRQHVTLTGFGLEPVELNLADPRDYGRLVTGPEKYVFLRAPESEQSALLEHLSSLLGSCADEPSMSRGDYLNVEDLVSLQDHGWLIGSHTHSHILMTAQSRSEIEAEWRRSIEVLHTSNVTRYSSFFAYPDGAYSNAIRDATEGASRRFGWRGALTIEPGPIGDEHDFALRRTLVSRQVASWVVSSKFL